MDNKSRLVEPSKTRKDKPPPLKISPRKPSGLSVVVPASANTSTSTNEEELAIMHEAELRPSKEERSGSGKTRPTGELPAVNEVDEDDKLFTQLQGMIARDEYLVKAGIDDNSSGPGLAALEPTRKKLSSETSDQLEHLGSSRAAIPATKGKSKPMTTGGEAKQEEEKKRAEGASPIGGRDNYPNWI